ncbi:MAG: type II toxin-antitoxin system VapC family toxin [Candidatus Chisholmbacteria bacterium]|nr:type II toxin-antitoxin system VapC family toxin [Candidatus Chisholmbacteria bacterium]
MPEFVIDASVVLKWFSAQREKDVRQARQIYQLLKDEKITLLAPPFLLVETLNILAKKKHISPSLQKQAMGLLLRSGIEFISEAPPDT